MKNNKDEDRNISLKELEDFFKDTFVRRAKDELDGKRIIVWNRRFRTLKTD